MIASRTIAVLAAIAVCIRPCQGLVPLHHDMVGRDRRTVSLNDRSNRNAREPFSEGSRPSEVEPVVRTIRGGVDTIFEMARQMLLWDQDKDSEPRPTKVPAKLRESRGLVLPRWRPVGGVSDANPEFRTRAPMMNGQGYAGTIWRNVRKANKPSLWRHALRTYDRMGQNPAQSATRAGVGERPNLKVQRTNLHHEGALVACAKLGLWEKALSIVQTVEEEQKLSSNYRKVFLNDNMVLSLIRSCVLASRGTTGGGTTLEERRAPLDACLQVLRTMEERHDLPLVARHINPIAAAFQKLGLNQEAADLIDYHLEDRTSGPEEEDGDTPFNLHDLRSKDKGSYSLLVRGAVAEGNWEEAVEALKTMTEAGLFPNSRNLNAWTEVSERKSKQRAARSWKKKRDEGWLETVMEDDI